MHSRSFVGRVVALTALVAFCLLATVSVAAEGADIGPYLSVAYRLVEPNTDRVIKELEAGRQYGLLVTVTANQRDGVKINPLFRTQEVELVLTDDRVRFAAEPRTRQESRNPKSRTARIDPQKGSAKFTIALDAGDALPADEITLKLVADLMICDDLGTYCAKTREESLLALPQGSLPMTSLPLGFNAGDKERIVLQVGDEAPDFTVTSDERGQVRLSDYRGKRHIILVFGRAHW